MTQLSDGLQEISEDDVDDFRLTITSLQTAVAAILAGNLDERLRATALRDAHQLADSLGRFGLPGASKLAHELQLRFAQFLEAVEAEDAHLEKIVRTVGAELDDNACEHETTRPCGPTRGAPVNVVIPHQLGDDRDASPRDV